MWILHREDRQIPFGPFWDWASLFDACTALDRDKYDQICYYTRAVAFMICASWNRDFADRTDTFDGKPPVFTVSQHIVGTEIDWWRERERHKLERGTYIGVPWQYLEIGNETTAHHYAHVSLEKPGLIAYTPDDWYGVDDRQIALRPGRYLERFYGHIDKSTRDCWVRAIAADAGAAYGVTETCEQAETIYMIPTGFRSCMDRAHVNAGDIEVVDDYGHPAQVYAAPGDLRVAFYPADCLETKSGLKQRAVIWPAKKTYYRIYGDGPLSALLARDGYREQSPRHARILAIETDADDVYLMPYVDGISCASLSDDGKFFTLGSGEYSTGTTYGHTGDAGEFSSRDNRGICDRCGELTLDAELEDHGGYCEYCDENSIVCHDCNGRAWEFVYLEQTLASICLDCSCDRMTRCTGCGTRFIEENCFTREQTEERSMNTTIDGDCLSQYCDDCVSDMRVCHDCDHYFDTTRDPLREYCDDCYVPPTPEPDMDRILAADQQYQIAIALLERRPFCPVFRFNPNMSSALYRVPLIYVEIPLCLAFNDTLEESAHA